MAFGMLSIFSLFSLQLGLNAPLHQQAQTTIWYAKSRFRQALIRISLFFFLFFFESTTYILLYLSTCAAAV